MRRLLSRFTIDFKFSKFLKSNESIIHLFTSEIKVWFTISVHQPSSRLLSILSLVHSIHQFWRRYALTCQNILGNKICRPFNKSLIKALNTFIQRMLRVVWDNLLWLNLPQGSLASYSDSIFLRLWNFSPSVKPYRPLSQKWFSSVKRSTDTSQSNTILLW